MESAFTQCFPSEFICSICKDNFTDPVTISCGHRFCTPCLCLLWDDAQTATCCPVCKAISPKMDFKSTLLAKEHILPTRESIVCQLPSSAKQMCRIHQVVKLYFCHADTSLLCLFCSHSPEHAAHEHYPIKQVAEHYRENLLMQMKSIWKKKKENQSNIKKVTNIFRVWEGVGDTMKRSHLMQLYIPQPMDPQLSTWAITGMLERLNSFRVYVTLDHKIRNCHVALTEDLRHLQCSPDHQDVPRNPASSENTPSWGAQTFTTGKHYWEVNVGNSRNWIIGLCKESWTSRNDMLLNSEDIFLLLCVSVEDRFSLFSTFPLLPHYIQRPQGWIGVFLDYECGIISFINVARSSLICNFLSRSFSFPLRPFIWCGPK
ncbi:tripartite motif-containing protein 77 isoform X2 [Balaenoptera ricei]|uniref:tripartite motif-containing protein 77 isoform X2 n=1 Tax=Balaenoptera ricei TaxID=2746895 RepID=UPI0028BE8A48|nr:tripartite motif-containing protein 77 isoform X2 [Balaenoptera ricei]